MSLIFYLLVFLLLFWNYAGYIIFLTLMLRIKRDKINKRKSRINLPSVEIIIPCFNEEDLIGSKIQNLLSLDYPPQKLSFVFADGGSRDKTLEIIQNVSSKNKRIQLVKTNLRNKIKQINKVLLETKTEIVIVSDVDTKLDTKTIKKLVYEFANNPQVAVVGAHTHPQKTIPIDDIYWQKQNQIRLLESKAISSSIVIASCYAFKKNLLRQLPEDVIADDIYIAFLAQSNGFSVAYTEEPLAQELRSPQKLTDFLRHKFRKAHAYIIEVLRFFTRSSQGRWQWQVIYFTKLLQTIVAPFLILTFLSLSVYFFFIETNLFLPLTSISGLLLSTLAASFSLKKTDNIGNLSNPFFTIFSFILINLILFLALLVYPFYKQTASYKKIK